MDKQEAKDVLEFLEHLKALSSVDKLLTSLIPAFQDKSIKTDEHHWLHGSFKLGGTKSGRLSSANPNLTNLPSTGTPHAKQSKKCFRPEKGWLFVGADFSSLEDRISALQTKDPNKLKVYTDKYDGHSLRAYSYFKEKMPDIKNTLESINSIEYLYPNLRQDSKMPTFALTYMGTYRTLVTNGGFSDFEAKMIEANYHELYKVSDEWVKNKIEEASRRGYVELAFGLRLRTPVLSQVILSSERSLPKEAHKEMKTAGNALGQSYGLLNTRACNEFMQRVWDSEWRYSIKPASQIHDAIYLCIKNNLRCLHWVNENLIECMEWCELPEIQHPTVKLGATLELYYPDWSRPYKIANRLSIGDLKNRTKEIHEQYLKEL